MSNANEGVRGIYFYKYQQIKFNFLQNRMEPNLFKKRLHALRA